MMTVKINTALQQYEELAEVGTIPTFAVYIQGEGILIKPAGAEQGQQVPLVKEMLTSLHAFFYGVEYIEYGSFDYTTLKSFVNASLYADGATE